MSVDLKGKQVERFRDALIDAFPSWRSLDAMVEFELGKSLERKVGPGPMEVVALELVRWARSESWLDDLLSGALRQNPTNAALRRLACELSLSSDEAPAPSLEALILPSVGFASAAQWRAEMASAERRVCRVELHDGPAGWRGVGTGALVAADVILTNAHVAQLFAVEGAGRVQFDHALDGAGTARPGRVATLATRWLLTASPAAELDFALIRLAELVGDDAVDGAHRRGWLAPVRHDFVPGEPLVILQHPGADRLKLAVGAVSDRQDRPPRVRYSTNTEPGSSGSPCFTMAWQLVGIHQGADGPVNRGIPVSAILNRLVATGELHLLGDVATVPGGTPGEPRTPAATAAAAPRSSAPRCPYPGMRSYSTDDAEHFHGRGAELDELLGRLRAGEREIYVIGPSGCGKSSLIAAGLLPRLAIGAAGLGPFAVRVMRPGEDPAARLTRLLELPGVEGTSPAAAVAALLARGAAGVSLLLVIDPLEELFTLAASDERARFLSLLEALQAESRCVTIFALRADFYGDFMESPLWARRSGRLLRIEVGPLRGERLREAIARPARALGVRIEDALIERLLADAAAEPGSLPLLQETLAQLWNRRQDPALTLADYQALGDGGRSGLAVTLARRADAVLRMLPPEREAIARRVLLRLVSFGEGRSDTRRQQPRSRLRAVGDDPDAFEEVLRQLIAGRLMVTDDDHDHDASVDLAHEVMITAWPTFAGWIAARRRDEQRRRQLEAAVAHWVDRGRGAGGLLDAVELAEVEAWRQTEGARELGEPPGMAELIAASVAARARQDQLQRDLESARKIQRSLLPAHPPDVVGLDFAIHYEPAHQLGVDFYDFVWHNPAHLGLVVGKVVGTPVSAALYIARLMAELRAYATITGDSPARLLHRVNQQIADLDEDGIFAPLVYCVYSLRPRRLRFTNAGHCVPLVRRGDRVFQLHEEPAHAPPLGVTPDYEASDGSVQLQPGDMLVIASYGILETRDAHGNDYGISRLTRRLATARGAVGDVLGEIVAEIHSHRGAPGQSEADMTLLAMSVGERRAEPVPETLRGTPPSVWKPEPDGPED